MGPSLWQSLCDPAPYRVAIERLIHDLARDPDGQVALLRREGDALAKRLAGEMAARTWRQQPVTRKMVMLDKPRLLVALGVVDRIAHAAVATALVARIEPSLSSSLYSYRPKRGQKHAINAVVEVAAAYHARGLPRIERGLFIVRFDVKSYGDSVPVGDDSELWPLLHAQLPDEDPWFLGLLADLIRCDGDTRVTLGIPNGSPLSNPMLNLYLTDLDRTIAAMALAYLRFGDDCLVICETREQADAATAEIERVLARKGLRANDAKFLRAYWNGAGRAGPAGWRGLTHVAYVGAEIGFDGRVRVKLDKRRALLDAITDRIANITKVLDPATAATDDDVRARGAALCAALRPMFDPTSPFLLPAVPSVLAAASCRVQLAEIDRTIAIAVAAAATGRTGPKAFRWLPWRTLYELGLPSFVAMRNHGWKRT